ncbi:MAG TPA: bacillithiol system redox-active protein YtxJ [Saprospiraceae bacterium]|mgnify:FL=1|nr:bacillithiol system redox-active protein YtxJ [Saprospiraceae bacterium]
MNWLELNSPEQVEEIVYQSSLSPVLIFKHSTTCNVSLMVKMRLDQQWSFDIPSYYLDLKKFREVSHLVASKFHVHHESPQVLVIKDGECVFDASHFDIQVPELFELCEVQF